MGTLRKVKQKMKLDRDFRKTLVRSAKDEIMIDVDGDGVPDIALMDSTGDGDIDTLAMDLTGDGEFNLYFHDSDDNGIPDMILLDEDGDGIIEVVAIGKEVEARMIEAANTILTMMAVGDYVAETLDQALDDMQEMLNEAKKELKG
ncbi:MAG: hypothetical protein LUC83_00175 [Clostridiales bacterium]|nr:hypothetical protein [Clostridiales bacterium]